MKGMPSEVIVTPEILAGQSAQMASLRSDYESLFASVSSLLTEINGSWSPNMANNFAGKIQSAQKSFSNVVGMLGNGSSAAKAASQIFADDMAGAVGGILGLIEQGSDFSDWMKNTLGAAGVPGLKGLDVKTLSQASDFVQKGDYESALKLLAEKGLDIGAGKMTEEVLMKQKEKYRNIMKLMITFADQTEAVQVWGLKDDMSWRTGQYALLFDKNINPKPAFYGVLEAVQE